MSDTALVVMEKVVINGDLSCLTSQERLHYYNDVCKSLGLNSLTKPFNYILMSVPGSDKKKLTLYATKDCTEQLRKINEISVTIVSREMTVDLYIVTARATDKKGRCDESIGAVSLKGKEGEMKANLLMKAETKAKRRVTLSICGLGMLDESEADSVPNARIVDEKDIEVISKTREEWMCELFRLIDVHNISQETILKWEKWGGVSELGDLSLEKVSKLVEKIEQEMKGERHES